MAPTESRWDNGGSIAPVRTWSQIHCHALVPSPVPEAADNARRGLRGNAAKPRVSGGNSRRSPEGANSGFGGSLPVDQVSAEGLGTPPGPL